MRVFTIVFAFIFIGVQQLVAQTSIKLLTEKKGVSLRGLAVPNKNVIWASGSKGSIALSINGGDSFEWKQVPGYETRDFRAIHAWDDKEAVIVAVAAPAVILKTMDGGSTWNKVYENHDTAMFLDAIAFKNNESGAVIGDPIQDTIFLLQTKDRGAHWSKIPANYWKSKVDSGEAFFASSNSNLNYLNNSILFISGGVKSRLWWKGEAMNLSIIQGGKSTGANSLAVSPNKKQIVIVGGDFMKDKNNNAIASSYWYRKNNFTKNNSFAMPNGYRSSVGFLNNDLLIACGTSGVDYSKNQGKTWEFISPLSFHVVKAIPRSKSAILAGSGGRIALLRFE
jgi:photosystem II stability/assembly factor-like uncharacterized protein